MSETPQAFYLRLNNHQGFMTGALAELYSNESMVDVTLTAEGQMIRAHQVVLSACSPYFKDILMQFHSTTHYPIIILKDMPFVDLKAIVEFIYRGEITIPRQQLESILTNGAVLQIKGLHEFNRDNWSDGDNVSNSTKTVRSLRRNACESREIKENKTKKRTRKSKTKSSTNSSGSNGSEKCANYGDILSSDTTNDDISNNKDNINNKIIAQNIQNNQNVSEKKVHKSENITSLVNREHNMENSMTADGDNIVPFNLLEQSMMIDVKQNVNINANHLNDESSSAVIPLFLSINSEDLIDKTDSDKQNKNEGNDAIKVTNETKNKDIFDDIPLDIMNKNSFYQKNINYEPLISDTQTSKRIKSRVSNAGIPRKGNSIRSLKKYKCPVCQKIYVSPQNMREHLRNTHTNPNQKYVCNVCEREYSWKHALDRHFKSKHSK